MDCRELLEEVEDSITSSILKTNKSGMISIDNIDTSASNFSIEAGKALIQRFNNEYTKIASYLTQTELKTVELDLFRDTEVLLFFPSKKAKGIIDSGFKNYHQMGFTSAAEGRPRSIDDSFVGVKMPRTVEFDEVRPKSAYLNTHVQKEIDWGIIELHTSYGGVAAKLNDSVKERSLVSNDDSAAIADTYYDYTNNRVDSFSKTIMHLNSFKHDFISTVSIAMHNFIEVLVFGKLEIKHVDYFLVDPKVVNDQDLIQLLKSTGKPVFEMKVEKIYKRFVYSSGAEL